MSKKLIHWFRQDLRIDNNPSLYNAFKQGDVLPVYIIDDIDAAEDKMGAASKVWLYHSLKALDKSLDGKLHILQGSAKEILFEIIKNYQIEAVYWNRCYEAWRIKRDANIKQALQDNGIEVRTFNSALLWEPWQILKKDQTPYKVFTHFYKAALSSNIRIQSEILTQDTKKKSIYDAKCDNHNVLSTLAPNKIWSKDIIASWEPGEDGAHKKLNMFLQDGIDNYKEGRNFPAEEYVSKLSPHIHFGEISVVYIWEKILRLRQQDKNTECFLSELGWREFAYYLLYHFSNLPSENLQTKFNQFAWIKDKTKFTAWKKGLTGYPIIDAAMRQLWQTGYMHNRCRMVVGSFLVKNLLIDWREGAKWFWDCLFDADLASNSASWQWVAGTGVDAAPYFRIFNPVAQGQKFDPDGKYTKKYVPELKDMPVEYLFNPWEAPNDILNKAGVIIGDNYPMPIVDIKLSREKALQIYKNLK